MPYIVSGPQKSLIWNFMGGIHEAISSCILHFWKFGTRWQWLRDKASQLMTDSRKKSEWATKWGKNKYSQIFPQMTHHSTKSSISRSHIFQCNIPQERGFYPWILGMLYTWTAILELTISIKLVLARYQRV